MPVPATTWKCKYFCGYVNTHKDAAINHEEHLCVDNPDHELCNNCLNSDGGDNLYYGEINCLCRQDCMKNGYKHHKPNLG